MSNNTSQGVYAPLPQSLSDSDSERDTNDSSNHPTYKMQNGHDLKAPNGYNIPNHVISAKKTGFTNMSTARKCAFISSITLCFLVVTVFLWGLPCSTDSTCPTRITNWKNEHDGVEFIGPINVIYGPYKNIINLALMAKKCLNSQDGEDAAIALKGTNGAIAWYVPLVGTPFKLDCNLIDTDGDQINDCLVLSEIGLGAYQSLSPGVIWHVHTEKSLVNPIDFPKLLPDLNGDGINELVTVTTKNSLHNMVIIVNGSNGKVLLDIIIPSCTDITNFKYEHEMFIYLCQNDIKKYHKLTLNDFKNKLKNLTYIMNPQIINNHPELEEIYLINDHRLFVENEGKCPNCQESITVIDETTLKKRYDWTHNNSYAFKPVSFSFKRSPTNIEAFRGHLNGFVLKRWQWTNDNNAVDSPINNGIKINNITEQVVLITFNDTNVHVINVSYVQLTQLCFPTGECQPDMLNRNDSLLIRDLDDDGLQELITYSTTYKCVDETIEGCHLVSTMAVIRLEDELPKLYAK